VTEIAKAFQMPRRIEVSAAVSEFLEGPFFHRPSCSWQIRWDAAHRKAGQCLHIRERRKEECSFDFW